MATDGNALVYCESAFDTPYGKTAHGLVRFTRRYRILGVVDSRLAGRDAGQVLEGRAAGIPIFESVQAACSRLQPPSPPPTHLVIGLAPDGGRLGSAARHDIRIALERGLNVDSGLHDFLADDAELAELASARAVKIRDVRRPPHSKDLHFFSGRIEGVQALKIAVLGTDSAVGKRTTAWKIVQAFESGSVAVQLIGTGQTAWMQGATYGVIMDSLINDFVSGEIEHAVWRAWEEVRPDVLVIEGQGSLMNPAYPGGFEILAAGRPDVIVLQHAPARKEYDGFPGYPIQPLARQIQVIEWLSGKPVAAVTINHENLRQEQIAVVCDAIEQTVGLPAFDVLTDGAEGLVDLLRRYLNKST
jgi:uncharacterized NAD-dependent epimerase/dehydratase family protein